MTFTTSRLKRIQYHLDEKIAEANLIGQMREEVNETYAKFMHIRNKAGKYLYILYICYFLLYVSILASITQNITVIGSFFSVFVIISGILGSSVLLALIALTHTVINMYVVDGNIYAMQIIALCSSAKKINSSK